MQRFAAVILVLLTLALLSGNLAESKDRRVHLAPHFVAGATLRYRIQTDTTSDEHMTTPVIDAQGGTQMKQTTAFVVRLDVLGVRPAQTSGSADEAVRFRATFEESHAYSQTDASPLNRGSLDDSIDKLAGHSFEFTLSNGAEEDVKGLDELTTDRAAAQSALAWIPVLADVGSFPREGIELGQKWNSERPLFGFPLAGMIWRSESSYLRDEPCGNPAAGKNNAGAEATDGRETCAVILTRFEMSRHGSEHSDATPEDYRRNGLRTSGKWTVSGESLNSVSLSDGFLVSSTQTAAQDMDYEIVSASSGSRIHQVGHTKTQTEITFLRHAALASP